MSKSKNQKFIELVLQQNFELVKKNKELRNEIALLIHGTDETENDLRDEINYLKNEIEYSESIKTFFSELETATNSAEYHQDCKILLREISLLVSKYI